MKSNYPKRILLAMLLCAFALTNSTCKKKISKYPFEMEGVWFSEDNLCGLVLVIEKSGEGRIFSQEGGFCVSPNVNAKGKVKYKKDVLYVDKKKFTIFNEPVLITTNDSIYAPDENDLAGKDFKVYRSLARMTLQEKGLLTLKETFTFTKYVDY